jgi:putative ABC transport system substrate-binding protein
MISLERAGAGGSCDPVRTGMSHESRTTKLVVLCAVFFALCTSAAAQQPQRLQRVGRLTGGSPLDPLSKETFEAFRDGLRGFGWIEGRNIVHEQRWSEDSPEALRAFAADLVQLPVDLIVANGSQMIRAAKQATSTIPIVMAASGADPVAAGYVASLARPGTNITGISLLSAQLDGKRMELLKDAVRRIKRMAVLYNPDFPEAENRLKDTAAAGKSLGVQLEWYAVSALAEIELAFSRMSQARPDSLLVFTDPVILERSRERIIALAFKQRIPAIYPWKRYTDEGGLMSYSPNLVDMHRRSAYYVDKILKGAKPADLPVEQPTKFELVINLKTAKQIGLTIPPNVLARADKVIR